MQLFRKNIYDQYHLLNISQFQFHITNSSLNMATIFKVSIESIRTDLI